MRKRHEAEREPLPEAGCLNAFGLELRDILSCDRFVARSDYRPLVDGYADLYAQFDVLRRTQMLQYFCRDSGISVEDAEGFLSAYEDLSDDSGSEIISAHNEEFVKSHLESEREYLDGILADVDRSISLDDDQRRVVLSDEDYMLVIAGAGAGKTTTVAAKVKYLVDRQGVRPDQILVISFTNKAVGELKEKINRALGIDCPITTFHKTGFDILRRQYESRKMVVD